MLEILLKILVLTLSALPLSVIAIKLINKYILKDDKSLASVGTLCTEVLGTLTKRELEVRSLYFNHFEGRIPENLSLLEIEDPASKETIKVDKIWLKKDQNVQLAAITNIFCHYEKTRHFEQLTNNFFRKCGFQRAAIEHAYDILQVIPTDNEKKNLQCCR